MSSFVKGYMSGRIRGHVSCLCLEQVGHPNQINTSHRFIPVQVSLESSLSVLFNEIKKRSVWQLHSAKMSLKVVPSNIGRNPISRIPSFYIRFLVYRIVILRIIMWA